MRVLIAVDGTDNAAVVMEGVAPWLRQAGGQAAVLTILSASGIHATQESASGEVVTPQGTVGGTALDVHDAFPRTVEDRTQAISRIEAEVGDALSALATQHLTVSTPRSS
jgi:hypothetical protein